MVAVLTVPTATDGDFVGGHDCWCCGEPWAGTVLRRGRHVCQRCAYMCAGCGEADKDVLATAVLWVSTDWARQLCADCWAEEGGGASRDGAATVPNPSHGQKAPR